MLGVGVGWPSEEFTALGVPFARRTARTKEYVAAMGSIWSQEVSCFAGEFVRFDAIRVNPKPLDGNRIPVVLGGNGDTALRRVARWGDGWYGFYLDGAAEVAQRVDYLRTYCDEAGRDMADLQVAVSLRDPDPGDLGRLADAGIDELVIVDMPPSDPREAATWVAALADRWQPDQR